MTANICVDIDSAKKETIPKISKEVNYISQGNGQPVLLVHGVAASLHDWSSLAPALAGQGYRACALDLLGHGESPKPDDPRAYHIHTLVEHFSAWVEMLDLNSPVFLVGHSLGGYISLSYACAHPERVQGIVLIDPLYSPRQLSPFLRLVSRRPKIGEKVIRITPEWIINVVMGWDPTRKENFSEVDLQKIANDYKRASPHIVYITQSIPDLTPNMTRITQPTLVIWGDEDRTLKPASFHKLVRSLPQARAQIMPGSGHQPHIGRPQTLNRLVLDFVESIGAPDVTGKL